MFDSVLNFFYCLFKNRAYLFYRERVVINLIWYRAVQFFWKFESIEQQTKLGKIRGVVDNLRNGRKYYSFRGIPYGKPPIGKLRFKPPVPAEPWTGTLDATKDSKKSLQTDYLTKLEVGGEDCLYLNVYTTELSSDENKSKPVMLFIHGGALLNGSSTKELYGPDYIIENDVVLVVIQYRLGLLGSLSIDNPNLGATGNTGFKDMVLALKWVQQNIGDFGGDANNVTIFGESAGSVAVHLLMLSPLSKGLFHKAIAQSGCALNGWSVRLKNISKKLALLTGCDSDDDVLILNHLQSLSSSELYAAQRKFDKTDRFSACPRYVGWVVEPPHENAFLTKSPLDIMLAGEFHKIPLVMGFTSCEGMLFEGIVAKHNKSKYWEMPEINVPALLEIEETSPEATVLGEKALQFYLGERPYIPKIHYPLLYHLFTDNCFLWGIYQSVRNHAKHSTQPVFLYRLSLESRLNFYKHLNRIQTPGVAHADDLGYLFKTYCTVSVKPNSLEDMMRLKICKLWTNFAKFGNPTPPDDSIIKINWAPVNSNRVPFLDIDKTLEMDENPEMKRMQFWNEIYATHPKTVKLL